VGGQTAPLPPRDNTDGPCIGSGCTNPNMIGLQEDNTVVVASMGVGYTAVLTKRGSMTYMVWNSCCELVREQNTLVREQNTLVREQTKLVTYMVWNSEVCGWSIVASCSIVASRSLGR